MCSVVCSSIKCERAHVDRECHAYSVMSVWRDLCQVHSQLPALDLFATAWRSRCGVKVGGRDQEQRAPIGHELKGHMTAGRREQL